MFRFFKFFVIFQIKISEEDLEPLGEQYKESLGKLKEAVEKEEKVDLKKIKSAKRSKPKFKKNQSGNKFQNRVGDKQGVS